MRTVALAVLGTIFGALLFAIQAHAQTPQMMPVMCGDYATLSSALSKNGEQVVGRGTNGEAIVEFWFDGKSEGTVVVRKDDKACMLVAVEGFKMLGSGKPA